MNEPGLKLMMTAVSLESDGPSLLWVAMKHVLSRSVSWLLLVSLPPSSDAVCKFSMYDSL